MGRFACALRYRQLDALIAEAQAEGFDDSPAMGEIVSRFDGMAAHIALGLTADRQIREDLTNSARVALTIAVRRHDLSRQSGFTAYAKRFMYGAALRTLKRSQRWGCGGSNPGITVIDFTDPSSEPIAPAVAPLQEGGPWGDGELAKAVASLSPSQQDLLGRRYVADDSLADIGADTGTTASAVRQRLATAHRALAMRLAAA